MSFATTSLNCKYAVDSNLQKLCRYLDPSLYWYYFFVLNNLESLAAWLARHVDLTILFPTVIYFATKLT